MRMSSGATHSATRIATSGPTSTSASVTVLTDAALAIVMPMKTRSICSTCCSASAVDRELRRMKRACTSACVTRPTGSSTT